MFDIELKSISETDAPHNYDVIQKEILPSAEGRIVIDPTGGRKVMGISLSAMAFWRRLPMVYLHGDEMKGIVIPFSERLRRVKNPYDHFGDGDQKLIKELFDRGDYDSALNVCEKLIGTVGDPATSSRLELQCKFIELYRDWGAFRHSMKKDDPEKYLATRLRKLQKKQQQLGFSIIPSESITNNIEFLQLIENNWKAGRVNIVDKYRLIDVFINAERKAQLGHYDDAIARLYRCMEMCSTLRLLRKWKVGNVSKPNTENILSEFSGEDQFMEQFQQKFCRNISLSGHAWGLDDQMKVLNLIEPTYVPAKIYMSMACSKDKGKNPL